MNPRLNPGLVISPAEDGYLAFNPATDRLHRLNATAALIAELCDGERNLAEIHALVLPLLPAGADGAFELCIREGFEAGLFQAGAAVDPPPERTAGELAKLSRGLRENGKILAAYICRQQAAELEPDDSDHWCALGELAHILGRRGDARAAYERYIEKEPEDAEVLLILVSLRDEAPPARVPDKCIEQLYQRFSSFFERNLRDDLHYQGPEKISAFVATVMGSRRDLAVLDLGCGTGLSGTLFRPIAASLVGIDLSPEMVGLARKSGVYDRVEIAEITQWLSLREDRFDLIVACDCFIYFGDLRQTVVPAARLLPAGGVIAFTVERGETAPFHLTDSGRFTHHPDHVRETAAAAGLDVAILEEDFLRMEYGEEVTGLFVVLTKP